MTQSVGAPTDMGEWTEGALGSLLGAGPYAAGQGVLGHKATSALGGLIDAGGAVPAHAPQTGVGAAARGGREHSFEPGAGERGPTAARGVWAPRRVEACITSSSRAATTQASSAQGWEPACSRTSGGPLMTKG